MYDELVKRLREEANGWCSNCCYRCGDNVCGAPDDRKKDCDVASELQAADAIEELQATLCNWCAVCPEDKRDLSTCEIYESCRAKPPKEKRA